MTNPTILMAPSDIGASKLIPTISAGSNRLVIITFCMYNGGGTAKPPTSVTCGGKTAQYVAGSTVLTTRVSSASYMFFEADVSSVTGGTVAFSGQTGTVTNITSMAVQDAQQQLPLNTTYLYASATGVKLSSLVRSANSFTIAIAHYNGSGSGQTMADPTRSGNINFSSGGAVSYGYAADTARTANVSVTATSTATSLHGFNILPVGAIINSINGGSAIPAGQVGATSSSSAFTALPTSITTSASGVTCSNISGSVNAATFDISDRVDGGLYPKDGTTVSFTFSNAVPESATGTQVVGIKPTETKVVLSSPITNDTSSFGGSVFAGTGRTLATNDEVYLVPYDDLVMAPDSSISVTNAGTFTCWVYINSGADAGKNYFYTVTVVDGGTVVDTTHDSFGSDALSMSQLVMSQLVMEQF